MRVDPEQLEREAEELQRQMMAQQEAPDEDTAPEQDEGANAPAGSADTAGVGDQTPENEDRGDPDSSLSEQLRLAEERVKNAQSRMTKATQEASELRRQVSELRAQIEELSAKIATVPEDDEDLRTLAEEYPDIASPILRKIEAVQEQVNKSRQQLEEERQADVLKRHFDTIRGAHPDFDEIVTSDEFEGWLSNQSPAWRRIGESGTAEEVVDLLARYKTANGNAPQQPESSLEKARKLAEPSLPRARKPDQNANQKIWTRREIELMPLDEFEKRQAEIDQALMEGRVR